jgi:hypothetical protein
LSTAPWIPNFRWSGVLEVAERMNTTYADLYGQPSSPSSKKKNYHCLHRRRFYPEPSRHDPPTSPGVTGEGAVTCGAFLAFLVRLKLIKPPQTTSRLHMGWWPLAVGEAFLDTFDYGKRPPAGACHGLQDLHQGMREDDCVAIHTEQRQVAGRLNESEIG